MKFAALNKEASTEEQSTARPELAEKKATREAQVRWLLHVAVNTLPGADTGGGLSAEVSRGP